MEGFWPDDNCRIIAVIATPIPQADQSGGQGFLQRPSVDVNVASAFLPSHDYRRLLDWVHRLTSRIGFGHWRVGMSEIWKKFILSPELCYFGPCGNDWHRETERLGVFTRSKGLKTILEPLQPRTHHNLGFYPTRNGKTGSLIGLSDWPHTRYGW